MPFFNEAKKANEEIASNPFQKCTSIELRVMRDSLICFQRQNICVETCIRLIGYMDDLLYIRAGQ